MKRLAALPFIALLALTGCTTPAPQPSSTAVIEAGDVLEPAGITVNVHQDLTAAEDASFNAGKKGFTVDNYPVTMLPAVVTESNGTHKNNDRVQTKHVRIVLDTSNLPYDCAANEHVNLRDQLTYAQSTGIPAEKAICVPSAVIQAAPTDGNPERNGEISNMTELLHRGKNVLEFDAVYADKITLSVSTHANVTAANALTGDTMDSFPLGYRQEVSTMLTPGKVDTINTKILYNNNQYTLGTGGSTLDKKQPAKPVLSVPLTTHLTGKPCTEETTECHSLTITTKKANEQTINGTTEPLDLPADFMGTLTISGVEFDEAQLHITDKVGSGESSITTIDLITGRTIKN